MNERIQKLYDQAGEYAALNATGDWEVGPAYQDLFNEKFAELIVRECSQIAHNSHPDYLPFVGGKMLVHFGVEE